MSELRVIHLLEGLCDAMSKFELVEAKNDLESDRWARSGGLCRVAQAAERCKRSLPAPACFLAWSMCNQLLVLNPVLANKVHSLGKTCNVRGACKLAAAF